MTSTIADDESTILMDHAFLDNQHHPQSYNNDTFISELPQQQLTDTQEKVLILLPIPTALLSIMGSVTIMVMAYRSRKRRISSSSSPRTRSRSSWTPYTRLLVGMSICDIIFSIHLSIANFMRPQETSNRVWAFGNDQTCTASGFLAQFSYSAIIYNGMLSFYFLLAARFGMKNDTIARWVEPLMHLISVGYPLLTAIVGVVKDYYAELEMGFGCWVSDHLRDCGDEPGQPKCNAKKIVWFYGAMPYLLTALAIVVNNLIIFVFVYRQTKLPQQRRRRRRKYQWRSREGRKRVLRKLSRSNNSATNEESGEDADVSAPFSDPGWSISFGESMIALNDEGRPNSDDAEDPISSSEDNEHEHEHQESSHLKDRSSFSIQNGQLKRLQLVRSQALYFVLSYVLSNAWTGMLLLIESAADTPEEEMEYAAKFYGISVMQAFFLPLQGFFNMLVYIRPKYIKCRHVFPKESRIWAFQRALFGEDVEPTAYHHHIEKDDDNERHLPPIAAFPPPHLVADKDDDKRECYSNHQTTPKKQRATKKAANEETLQQSPAGFTAVVSEEEDFSWPVANKLPPMGILPVSSMTASEGDFTIEEEHEEKVEIGDENDHITPTSSSNGEQRWEHTKQDLSSWVPIKKVPRFQSSVTRGSSLEVISELSEVSFVEATAVDTTNKSDSSALYDIDESDIEAHHHHNILEDPSKRQEGHRRWNANNGSPKQVKASLIESLRKPERIESAAEDVPTFSSTIDDPSHQVLRVHGGMIYAGYMPHTKTNGCCDPPVRAESKVANSVDSSVDTPIQVPKRRLSNSSSTSSAGRTHPSSTASSIHQQKEAVNNRKMLITTLTKPERVESITELLPFEENDIPATEVDEEEVESSSFDRMQPLRSDRSTDSPIQMPKRRLSPTPV